MTDEIPDPQTLIKLVRRTTSAAERRKKYRRIDFLDESYWYPSQRRFFAAGSSGVHQRLIYGGNQSGKTEAAMAELAWQATGLYPPWWTGLRFDKALLIWALSESSILGRDTIQKKLFGPNMGEGLIPLECFARKPIMVPGGTGTIDTLFVTHYDANGAPDGVTQIVFKSYEQKREKLQGATVDVVFADEKPPSDIYSEPLARTSASNGHILVSYTPVGSSGAEGVTYKYLSEHSDDRVAFCIPGSEAKHITVERRDTLRHEYSEAERESRLEGTPQLGAGPVFPLELLPTVVAPFSVEAIPAWAKWIVGIDFGFDHPFAAVLIAWVPDMQDL
jgi:phage terminase large subunit-like protein